jgi:hypothetical protein
MTADYLLLGSPTIGWYSSIAVLDVVRRSVFLTSYVSDNACLDFVEEYSTCTMSCNVWLYDITTTMTNRN